MSKSYTPQNWFWIVGGDESRFWSSAAGAYVTGLPGGAGVTRIASAEDLSDVLAVYGLPGPAVRVPDAVSARQFRMQLRISGLRDAVVAWIATQDGLTQDAFEYSGTFERSSPMMQAGFAALGFTEDQGDAFFLAAAAL